MVPEGTELSAALTVPLMVTVSPTTGEKLDTDWIVKVVFVCACAAATESSITRQIAVTYRPACAEVARNIRARAPILEKAATGKPNPATAEAGEPATRQAHQNILSPKVAAT
ncbi:hypothetical protein [Bradyrhizobium septentrionale]|uniref:Uncharacterized protein n=1 Tax=Bradyrhizobium septentrionale TaxID=1404411 RepID=A0ABZ2P757_9BRAD